MKWLHLLVLLSSEVIGIVLLGYFLIEYVHLNGEMIGIGISVLIIFAFAKFIWLIHKNR